jgi:hypothetical protein
MRAVAMTKPGGRLVAFGVSGVISGEKRSLVAGLRTLAHANE